MKKILIGSLTAIIILNSCLKSVDSQPTCDSNYDPCALKAPQSEIDKLEAYLDTTANIGNPVPLCSGMYYVIDSVGTGKQAGVCSTINIKYKGMLTDSTVFEDRSASVVQFPLGQLIAGFKNSIPLIKEGGGIRLYVPPTLGYGNKVNGSIPANSILIFQVSLISVQ